MTRHLTTWLRGLTAGAGLGIVTVVAAPAWSQAPAVTDPPAAKPAVDAAKDTANDATKAASDTTKDAANTAREAVRDTTKAARETTRDAREGVRNVREGAGDTARDAREGARDTARDAREGTRDTVRGAREGVRDAKGDARDTTRDARETVRDARDNAANDPNSVRGAVREGVRDTAREIRDDVEGTVRDTARNIRNRDSANLRVEDMRSADIGLWFNSSNNGLVISDLNTTGPIAQVGFREGDRIVSVNGQKVVREADFNRYLFANDVRTERVKVIVIRDGSEQTVYLQPTVFVEQYTTVNHDPLEHFGVVLDDRYDDRLIVWKVLPRTPAYYAGIRAGDVIVTFEGQQVTAPNQFISLIGKVEPGTVNVGVKRNNAARQISVDVQAQAHSTNRQNLDRDNAAPRLDRRDDRQEGRENREEGREERRDDRRDNPRSENRDATPQPVPNTINPPTVTPPTVTLPSATPPAAAPAPRSDRPGLLPRRN